MGRRRGYGVSTLGCRAGEVRQAGVAPSVAWQRLHFSLAETRCEFSQEFSKGDELCQGEAATRTPLRQRRQLDASCQARSPLAPPSIHGLAI